MEIQTSYSSLRPLGCVPLESIYYRICICLPSSLFPWINLSPQLVLSVMARYLPQFTNQHIIHLPLGVNTVFDFNLPSQRLNILLKSCQMASLGEITSSSITSGCDSFTNKQVDSSYDSAATLTTSLTLNFTWHRNSLIWRDSPPIGAILLVPFNPVLASLSSLDHVAEVLALFKPEP